MIPVIDIFAGPGGLGEGFSSTLDPSGAPAFKIKLSLEKEANAHSTLRLRAFFRQFFETAVPDDYYRHLRGEISQQELFALHSEAATRADQEAVQLTLGENTWSTTEGQIRRALNNAREWVLIGGPPCQAYSLVGRARNKGKKDYVPADDERHFLYREYLRILSTFHPSVFVMENVKGLLSSKPEGSPIFEQLMQDLKSPTSALYTSPSTRSNKAANYKLYSLAAESNDSESYVLKSELYGVPQARHRVIIVGVREDIAETVPTRLAICDPIPAKNVLYGLPAIRSGISRETDSADAWISIIHDMSERRWYKTASNAEPLLGQYLDSAIRNARRPRNDRGGEFVACEPAIAYRPDWFIDKRINGVCNHSSRAHITKDLYRYLYAACYAKAFGTSPRLRDFPPDLLPNHDNVSKAVEEGNLFEDRFRVQLSDRPSTTITSHISKDGHYYIHPDPTQCRSLTVREAARLQTFPDNYFFTGPRTAQYTQVGNAVPPLMAAQIAQRILELLQRSGISGNGSSG